MTKNITLYPICLRIFEQILVEQGEKPQATLLSGDTFSRSTRQKLPERHVHLFCKGEFLQADGVQSRQAVLMRCYLRYCCYIGCPGFVDRRNGANELPLQRQEILCKKQDVLSIFLLLTPLLLLALIIPRHSGKVKRFLMAFHPPLHKSEHSSDFFP